MTHNFEKSYGTNYIPPKIKGVPMMKRGCATIRLAAPLTGNARKSFKEVFIGCCNRMHLDLKMVIDGIIITIKRAAHKILHEVLKSLEIVKPQPKATSEVTKKKAETTPSKKSGRKSRKTQVFRPAPGLHLAVVKAR